MKYLLGFIFILCAGLMFYGVKTQQERESGSENATTQKKKTLRDAEFNAQEEEKKIDHLESRASTKRHSSSVMRLLEDKCIKCHGAEVNGRKKIKGKFDLKNIYDKGIRLEDSETWVKVIEQIENQQMPPSDSKTKLSDKDGMLIVDMLNKKLNVKTIRPRRLTSSEVNYSMSDIFNYDIDQFDPFGTLHFATNSGEQYSTVYSPILMTSSYLKEVEFGTGLAIENYVAPQLYGQEPKYKDTEFELFCRQDHLHATIFVDMDHSKKRPYIQNPIGAGPEEIKKLDKIRAENVRRESKYMEKQKKEGKRVVFDLRTKTEEYLLTHSHPQPKKRNLPPGKYRLSFDAMALNRDVIQNAFKLHSKKTQWINHDNRVWGRLAHEKARLEFRLDGQHRTEAWHIRPRITGAKRGKLVGSFPIEDNVKKTYSVEFELKAPDSLTLSFVNGPIGHHQIYLNVASMNLRCGKGKCWMNLPGREYKLPCVRVFTKFLVKRISGNKSKSKYDLSFEKNVTESLIRNKINEYIKELSLEHDGEKLKTFYDKLPANMSLLEKYKSTLKMITMSPDFLYIDFSEKTKNSAERYASYALLKTHPTKKFKQDYQLYKNNKMTSAEFTKKIVASPSFNNFLKNFTKAWLGLGAELDEKKYSKHQRELPFREETDNYIRHIFKKNRPIRELYDSDYKIINPRLGVFYNMNGFEKIDCNSFSIVKTKRPDRGGIINQGMFFISHSSGVDPLPFARAKWISENVFDRKILDPPNNVNTDEFKSTKLKTFKERTEAHSQNEACISCHKILDPIAFAMHNFDTIGQRIKKQDNEAETKLLQDISNKETNKKMARAFTRELISFVIGREPTVYDNHVVSKILTKTQSKYAVRDILAEIIGVYLRK